MMYLLLLMAATYIRGYAGKQTTCRRHADTANKHDAVRLQHQRSRSSDTGYHARAYILMLDR